MTILCGMNDFLYTITYIYTYTVNSIPYLSTIIMIIIKRERKVESKKYIKNINALVQNNIYLLEYTCILTISIRTKQDSY